MSLTPYVVAIIKCNYDGPPEGDFAPISCFTPPSSKYVLAANLEKGTYAEVLDCNICIFEVEPGLYIINVWNGQEWRVDYVEAPQKGYIVTGAKTEGSIFTTSSEVTAVAPPIDIWQAISFFFVSYTIGHMLRTISPQLDVLQELIVFIITYIIIRQLGIIDIWQAFVILLVMYLIVYIVSGR